MPVLSEKILNFYKNLKAPAGLPKGVEVMNPYGDKATWKLVQTFIKKFYPDNHPRICILGINPGRFGAGVTGINFTDTIALEKSCGIEIPANVLRTRETSEVFIYEVINTWGGPEKFYKDFFLSAASPLGLVKNDVNYNYYDDAKTAQAMTPFIVESINSYVRIGKNNKAKPEAGLGCRRDVAIILGTGKNFKFLSELNAKQGFFKKLYPLEHPRFIMQYKSKEKAKYITKYIETLREALWTIES